MWNLAQDRAPGEVKVHVYNPEPERDGWESPHTVIEVVSDDMPFIVDSVTMELARGSYGIDLVIHPVIRVRRDDDGQLLEVLEPDASAPDAIAESVLHAEIARERDPGGWPSCTTASSGCSTRSAPRSRTGDRCASEPASSSTSSTSTRRRSTLARSRRSSRSCAGWPRTTSRSSATASTTS